MKTIIHHIWVASYEHNWGTRFPRHFTKVNFDYKPSKEEALQALKDKGIDGLEEKNFTYGPLRLHKDVFEIKSK